MKIKYPAVIVAALVHFFLGGLWYSPLLFANKFLQLINWTPEQVRQMESQGHAKELVIAFVMSFLLVYILAHFVQYTKATNAIGGIQTAFWLWLGFIVTTQVPLVLFERRSFGLFLINVGYQFVGCALAGAILAVWRTRECKTKPMRLSGPGRSRYRRELNCPHPSTTGGGGTSASKLPACGRYGCRGEFRRDRPSGEGQKPDAPGSRRWKLQTAA